MFVLVMVTLLPGASAGQSQRAMTVREADAPCAGCHREIVESYLKTPMANASGLAEDRLHTGTYRDGPSGMEYTVSRDADGAVLRYAKGSGAGAGEPRGSERLAYFLGSGHIGLTYLYEKNGYWLESPVAFYEKLQGYGMKPGAEGMHSMPPALPLNPSCLRCHMGGVAKQVEGTDNLYRGLPFAQMGIPCEGCHGDAREHVATKGQAAAVNPVKLAPERRDSTCVVCHLEGDTSVERRGKAVLDYKPGDDIRESITYFVKAGEMSTKRAVSEIEQFNVSRCKMATGPAMSCMNCHDPHRTVAETEKVGFYRAKCLTCHETQGFVAAKHAGGSPDCIGCHMPKTASENIAHVAWTDHRIRRRPDGALPVGLERTDVPVELVSVLGGPTQVRDLGLAYYNLAVDGMKPARVKAKQLLTVAARKDAGDAVVERSLGVLAEMEGNRQEAAGFYRAALAAEPANYAAGMNLGTLLAQGGDLEAAVRLWTTAFQNNQDVPELGQNLAIVECRLGDAPGAEAVLKTVLTYSPGVASAREMLVAIGNGRQTCGTTPGLAMHSLQ